MVKLKDLIKEWTDESFKNLPKRWSKKPFDGTTGLTEFEQAGGKDNIAEGAKYGSIYDMKAQMKDGTFDPDNPEVLIHGWGRLPLKSVHRWIAKHLKDIASDAATVSDRTAKNIQHELYHKHSPLMHKINALNEVYEYMGSSQYKRAVTIYKRRR
tara:strand:+ start:330 stop:794 length:465 start_codon:yes stop_codon:yes gene_type:complete